MREKPVRRPIRKWFGLLAVIALLAFFEIVVGFLGSGMTGLRLGALVAFGVIILGNEAYRRTARR